MSVVNKLSINFATQSGSSTTLSFKYVNPNVSISKIKALINGIIANNVLWSSVPVKAKSAKLVQTEENTLDID